MDSGKRAQIVASDVGGTTDMMVVDGKGNFAIGKASTTPDLADSILQGMQL